MRRGWWTVWIEVAILAAALFFAYRFAINQVESLLSPYLIEEDEVGERSDNMIKEIMEKVEEKLDVRIDYENMIFDYANEYAKTMMEKSQEERQFQSETFSVVEDTDGSEGTKPDDEP